MNEGEKMIPATMVRRTCAGGGWCISIFSFIFIWRLLAAMQYERRRKKNQTDLFGESVHETLLRLALQNCTTWFDASSPCRLLNYMGCHVSNAQ
jgi:hypothetical protein